MDKEEIKHLLVLVDIERHPRAGAYTKKYFCLEED